MRLAAPAWPISLSCTSPAAHRSQQHVVCVRTSEETEGVREEGHVCCCCDCCRYEATPREPPPAPQSRKQRQVGTSQWQRRGEPRAQCQVDLPRPVHNNVGSFMSPLMPTTEGRARRTPGSRYDAAGVLLRSPA
eukprot:1176909-Prorocentrum_minimum.AAC.6